MRIIYVFYDGNMILNLLRRIYTQALHQRFRFQILECEKYTVPFLLPKNWMLTTCSTS